MCQRDLHRVDLLNKVTGARLHQIVLPDLRYPRDILWFAGVFYVCDANQIHCFKLVEEEKKKTVTVVPDIRNLPFKPFIRMSEDERMQLGSPRNANANCLCVNPKKGCLYVTHSDSVEVFSLE